LGWLIGDSAGATMALIAFVFVVSALAGVLPQGVFEVVHPLLPSQAAAAMLDTTPPPGSVPPGLGAGLSVLYVLTARRWCRGG
jgi:hypothetical protein